VLRIIAGTLGGRRIAAPPGRSTRPTREAVREAWFSALGPGVAGARVLDLFAGSGALGIEALSRGAAAATFVERGREAARVLARNLDDLGLGERSRVVRSDVGSFLQGLPPSSEGEGPPFDLALADPPYASDWPRRLATRLAVRRFAGLLCVEHAPGALENEGVVWRREYGDTILSFLRPTGEPAGGDRRPERQPPQGRRS
jgi:16S rRNA (guanine966-N2)-methyltransferase